MRCSCFKTKQSKGKLCERNSRWRCLRAGILDEQSQGFQATSSHSTSSCLLRWEVTVEGWGPVVYLREVAPYSTQYKLWLGVKDPECCECCCCLSSSPTLLLKVLISQNVDYRRSCSTFEEVAAWSGRISKLTSVHLLGIYGTPTACTVLGPRADLGFGPNLTLGFLPQESATQALQSEGCYF